MIDHQTQWLQLQKAWERNRFPYGLLLVGPLHCNLPDFTQKIARLLLCSDKNKAPCGDCSDCNMVKRAEHPDMEWIRPEKSGGIIKIDQVRELQNTSYLTPKRRSHRLMVLEAADRMNSSSANALLKILEEPAKHTVFILLAQQLGTILPTVLSRCAVLRFSGPAFIADPHFLNLIQQYPEDSDRGIVLAQAKTILDELVDLLEHRTHPCILAARWSRLEADAVLWFLYLVFAHVLNMKCGVKENHGFSQFHQLSILLNQFVVFKQIDKINALMKKLNHNINVNFALGLEDLLFALVPNKFEN